MPPISVDPQPQLTRVLKPAKAAVSGGASVASAASSGSSLPSSLVSPGQCVTQADLQRGDLTGLRLGPYELRQRIGHGGMGQVFLARHQALGKQFAIKFLAGDILQNVDAERRFQEEITSLGKLQHPNILSAVDAGRSGDVHYLVTEYVDGKDLARLVAEQGPLQPAQARDFLRQAAAGLACAHAHGFVHRDIKPSNLVVDAHGTLQLLDFGLVRNQQQADDLTSIGQLLGTIDFLSPEQAADGRSADFRSDLYSIGCTLLFLLTGKPPFSGEQFASVAAKIHGHLFVTPPALSDPQTEASYNIPAELSDILHRLLKKNPADRFQSAEELIDTLDRQRHSSGTSHPPVDTTPRNSHTPAVNSAPNSVWRKRLAVVAVASTTLLIAGPLRSAVRASRSAEKTMVTSTSPTPAVTAAVGEHRPADVPATNQSSTPSSNAAALPEDNGLVKIAEATATVESTVATAEPIVVSSTVDAPTEEVPESEKTAPAPSTPTPESQTAEAMKPTAVDDENSTAEQGVVSREEADTAEFRASRNVNSRQMVLPGKSLSGKAGRLLKSGHQKNQE